MRTKFLSVFTIFNSFRKMSHIQLRTRNLISSKEMNCSNVCPYGMNFIRKISFTSIFHHSNLSSDVDLLLSDPDYGDMAGKIYRHPGMGHNLLIIQPRLKTGLKRDTNHSAQLKMSEAVALVETLPDWKVVDKHIIPVLSLGSKVLFGKGNLEKLRSILQKDRNITGIFIGVNILTALQNSTLEKFFKVQIFDRYQIVLQIFHDHAHTKEAKLQIALAEIPYLRVKLCEFSYSYKSDTFTSIHHVGGSGETYMETRRRLLMEREIKLKKALGKVKKQRDFLRQSDKRKSYAIVAVVGYTNCGKTTLIKALTKDSRLKPEDKLFATLDVTLHAGFLPSSQKVLYVDTVGFISDVPTVLIEAFKATLEDIASADCIVHVRDVSHPDSEAQKAVVIETLKSLALPESLSDSIIEVGNKIDLVDKIDVTDENFIPISATEGTNLQQLSEVIEQNIFKNTGRTARILRVPNGGEEYRWLYKEVAVRDAVADESDFNYLIVEAVMSDSDFAKFTHIYGDMSVCLAVNT